MSNSFETHLVFTGPDAALERLALMAAGSPASPGSFDANAAAGVVAHSRTWMGEVRERTKRGLLAVVGTDGYAIDSRVNDISLAHPELRIHAVTYAEHGDVWVDIVENGKQLFLCDPDSNRRRQKRGHARFEAALRAMRRQ